MFYLSEIQEIFDENFALTVEPETTISSLNLDGIDFAVLISAIEERFSITIDDDEALKLNIVEDIESLINGCIAS